MWVYSHSKRRSIVLFMTTTDLIKYKQRENDQERNASLDLLIEEE